MTPTVAQLKQAFVEKFWGIATRGDSCSRADFITQLGALLAAEREAILTKLYPTCSAAVATLCDEQLDRSGGLLGRVREQAAAIRGRKE